MVDKNLFIQDLKQVFTVLQELKCMENYIKELIDKYNENQISYEEFKQEIRNEINVLNTKIDSLDLNEISNTLEELSETVDEIKGLTTTIQNIETYTNSIKDYIIQNENTTEIGGNLDVDGKVKLNTFTDIETNDNSTPILYQSIRYIITASEFQEGAYIYIGFPTSQNYLEDTLFTKLGNGEIRLPCYLEDIALGDTYIGIVTFNYGLVYDFKGVSIGQSSQGEYLYVSNDEINEQYLDDAYNFYI